MKRTVLLAALALAAPALAAKPTVAILYFDYEGKNEEMAQLKKGLAQMLISDLTSLEQFQIVERARLQELLEELKLNQTNKIDPATAGKIGKLLGARYMVMGGYFDLLGTLRVDARVVEVETGKILKATGSAAKPDDFLTLEQKIAGELGNILATQLKPADGAAPATDAKAPKRPAKLPAKTALRYAKALDAMDKKDKDTAKKELEAVVKEQPDFQLAALDLAALAR